MASAMEKPKRWAAMSASANAEADYFTVHRDPATTYAPVYICQPIEGAEEIDGSDLSESTCDGGESCICQTPAAAPYYHQWMVSRAGYRKYSTQYLHALLRDPATYDMYTFNDHYGYGQLEMMQNLLLDFVEAERSWEEQWAIIEGAVLWLLDEESTPLLGIGTCEDLVDLFNIFGRMFLSVLARLELCGLFNKVPSLGAVMSMYVELAERLRRIEVLEKERKIRGAFNYDVSHLDKYVLAYSQKQNIALPYQGSVDAGGQNGKRIPLPAPTMNKNDPWGFVSAFKRYRKNRSYGMAFYYCGFMGIGGDALDITTWDREKRSAKSFHQEDPLTDADIKAMKEGLVMHFM